MAALTFHTGGCPQTFVRLHREALESEHVSERIHEWIDLIWGHKQQGQASIEAKNVFFHLTYAGRVDIDAIADPSLREATEVWLRIDACGQALFQG